MKYKWQLGHGQTIDISEKAIIMGILNMTPDSFSDGNTYHSVKEAVAAACKMTSQGAHIIDIGGESTRPGAESIDAATEQARILPVIKELDRIGGILISVDTYRAETALLAVEAGAHIINDIWGLQKKHGITDIAAQTGTGVVIMHTGRDRKKNMDVIVDQQQFFAKSLVIAEKAGIQSEQIVLDPGFGFAKTTDENIALMHRATELLQFGFPLLAGTSRKTFIGKIAAKQEVKDRDVATSATSVILRMAGCSIFRVHNIMVNRDALAIADAVRMQKNDGF